MYSDGEISGNDVEMDISGPVAPRKIEYPGKDDDEQTGGGSRDGATAAVTAAAAASAVAAVLLDPGDDDEQPAFRRRISARLPAWLQRRIVFIAHGRALREAAKNREIDRAMARIAAAETEDEETKAKEADETAREERLQWRIEMERELGWRGVAFRAELDDNTASPTAATGPTGVAQTVLDDEDDDDCQFEFEYPDEDDDEQTSAGDTPRTGVGLAAAAVAAATAAALLAGGASPGGGVATALVDAMARAAELSAEIRSRIGQFTYRAHKAPTILVRHGCDGEVWTAIITDVRW